MKSVWIVMAGKGEYSDREEWVCGVYEDEVTARRMVEERNALDRELEEKHRMASEAEEARVKALPKEEGLTRKQAQGRFWTRDRTLRCRIGGSGLTPEELAEVLQVNQMPEYPATLYRDVHSGIPYPEADGYWVVCAPIGEWGKWDE